MIDKDPLDGSGEPEEWRWKRLLPYLAPAVLVVVGLNQFALAHLTPLTPWKGGGFGMFSVISGRQLRVYVVKPGEEEERLGIRGLGRVVTHVHNYPTDKSLQHLADLLAERGRDRLADATAIRVEVWATRFDPDTTTLTHELLNDLTHELTDEDD